jgi:tetratricopeptide (TPR) repeat protein
LLLSRQVSSPHVVRIHDIAQHEDRWLISMDLVEGEPLDKVLDREGRMPVERALAIARQVALGLGAAHARGVIHRDLKPSNVLLTPEGTAYISDFGIARTLGSRGMTVTGTVVGTPDYLSPEQARAEAVDARSDLYALGLLLYEMLSGEPAYAGGTQSEALTQRLVGPPPPIRRKRPDVPAWLERLLDRLLRSNPAHRPRDAEAVVKAIDARHVARDWRPGKRSALAAIALLVAGAIAWFAWQRGTLPLPMLPLVAPPERLVVLPVENASGDAALAPAAAAISEHLRQALAASAGLPVVDGERVEQALAQTGLPDAPAAARDLRALLQALPATRVLQPRLVHGPAGFAIEATLGPDAESVVRGPPGADVLAAARAFTPAAARALVADAPPPANTLPANLPALLAYGEGLAQRRAGRVQDAATHFAAAARADPGYAAAWLAQAQALSQAGMSAQAGDAAAKGRKLAGAKALGPGFAQVEALVGAEPGPAIAALQARLQARPDDLDAQLRLAQLQGQANALPAAIAGLRALLERDQADPRAWFLLGKYSIMHGEISSAIDESLVRALVLYKRGRNPYGQAETVNALGVAYSRLGQSDDAREQFGKAVELRRALGDRRGVASSLRNLAQLSIVQGRFDEAQAQLDEARTLFAAIGDDEGLAAVDNELGLLAEERGDFTGAEAAFRRVLRAREAAGDDYGIAESLDSSRLATTTAPRRSGASRSRVSAACRTARVRCARSRTWAHWRPRAATGAWRASC